MFLSLYRWPLNNMVDDLVQDLNKKGRELNTFLTTEFVSVMKLTTVEEEILAVRTLHYSVVCCRV